MTGRFLSIESPLRLHFAQGFSTVAMDDPKPRTYNLQPINCSFDVLSIAGPKELLIGCRCSVMGFSLSAKAAADFAKP